MSASALVVTALVVALAATVQLAAGFGFGLAAVPLLAVVLDAHDAVVLALALATFTNTYQAWTGRHDADRRVVARLLAGAAIGLPVGLLVFRLLEERWLKLLIGLTVLAAVVLIARRIDLRHAGRGLDVTAGVMSGALTMSSGVNGPPLVFVLQARHFPPARFRGTITTVFAVLDVVSVATFAIADELDGRLLQGMAAALPGLAAGAVVGMALRRHLHVERFRVLVLVLLSVAATTALVSALASGS